MKCDTVSMTAWRWRWHHWVTGYWCWACIVA